MSTHHKIWENGKNPSRRNDKGKKKPQAIRQARKRRQELKKRLKGAFVLGRNKYLLGLGILWTSKN